MYNDNEEIVKILVKILVKIIKTMKEKYNL